MQVMLGSAPSQQQQHHGNNSRPPIESIRLPAHPPAAVGGVMHHHVPVQTGPNSAPGGVVNVGVGAIPGAGVVGGPAAATAANAIPLSASAPAVYGPQHAAAAYLSGGSPRGVPAGVGISVAQTPQPPMSLAATAALPGAGAAAAVQQGMPPLYYTHAAGATPIIQSPGHPITNVNNSHNSPLTAAAAAQVLNGNHGIGDQFQIAGDPQALVPPSGLSTPWTLGSTDGSFAIQLAVLEQQRYQQQLLLHQNNSTSTANISSTTSSNDHRNSLNHNNSNNNSNGNANHSPDASSSDHHNQQQKRKAGAAIAPLTGDACKSVSSASGNASSPVNSITGVACNDSSNPGRAMGGNSSVQSGSTAEESIIQQQRLHNERMTILSEKRSLFQDRLFRQPSSSVESVLAASCEVMGFDIAEMWLRTGPKTHQLTNSHLRPTALEDSVRKDLVDVYYGEKSSERTHRLSPALCKRAKEANDVVWVTAHTSHGAEALRCSISNVRTAAAVPICHEASNTNMTIIFFSIRRIIVRPTSVEFLVHMSLAAGVAAVNSLAEEGLLDRGSSGIDSRTNTLDHSALHQYAHSEHVQSKINNNNVVVRHQRFDRVSVTGAALDLQWRQLHNVEYLTDGGNSWIHTAVFNGKPVVVKTLKPECQDVALAINEIEGELAVHSRLSHPNIVDLMGAGTTSKGVRFVVLERLDGGTLSQRLGYDNRIRDRRRRFWRRKHFSYLDVLRIAKSIAQAMSYCHEEAIPRCVVLHRDLKPDNIGFTLDGTVKILDFGLAKIVENASVDSNDVYTMSGETGSLRYMAPEVADALPYNAMADVYSYGIILWELNAGKKPFDGLNREMFYERVVHGGERPHLHRKWPSELTNLMKECWDADMENRPKFREIVSRLDDMLNQEKGGSATKKKPLLPRISGMIDRHSTWF